MIPSVFPKNSRGLSTSTTTRRTWAPISILKRGGGVRGWEGMGEVYSMPGYPRPRTHLIYPPYCRPAILPLLSAHCQRLSMPCRTNPCTSLQDDRRCEIRIRCHVDIDLVVLVQQPRIGRHQHNRAASIYRHTSSRARLFAGPFFFSFYFLVLLLSVRVFVRRRATV